MFFERVAGVAVFVILLFFLLMFGLSVHERASCKNGETVRDPSGDMDCWGSDTYKHCEPSTTFICHDKD